MASSSRFPADERHCDDVPTSRGGRRPNHHEAAQVCRELGEQPEAAAHLASSPAWRAWSPQCPSGGAEARSGRLNTAHAHDTTRCRQSTAVPGEFVCDFRASIEPQDPGCRYVPPYRNMPR